MKLKPLFVLVSTVTLIIIFFNFNYNNNNKTIGILSNIDSSYPLIKLQHNTFDISINIDSTYTTVISIYFSFKSKHSHRQYKQWMINILKSVHSPMVIFVDEQSKNFILNIRLRMNFKTKIIVYDNIWKIMNELEVSRNISYLNNYLIKQNKLDPEKYIHNSNLYAIWNLKSYLCNKIVQENPFNSSFFIYTDIGAWRNEMIPYWPNNNFISSLVLKLNDRILFGQVNEVKEKNINYDHVNSDIIEGTFFAGSKKAIEKFYFNFYKIHDKRLKDGIFIGKDQITMNIYAFLDDKKNDVVRLRTWDLNCTYKNGNKWFFYQYYFALNEFYNCLDDKIFLLINL
jgi:hypothetical protein